MASKSSLNTIYKEVEYVILTRTRHTEDEKEQKIVKSKMLFVIISCLMVVALMLTSCGKAEQEEEVVAGEVMVKDSLGRTVEKPQYGGVITIALSVDTLGFDEINTLPWNAYSLSLTNEMLIEGNYAKGPTGSGETGFNLGTFYPVNPTSEGRIAESWEMPDNKTVVYHIRKGIHWHDKALVNGRELTAEDVAFSIKRIWESDTAYNPRSYTAPESVTATDKWTVTMKFSEEQELEATLLAMQATNEMLTIVPPEPVEKYGDMREWETSCGTGAYMLVDYVPASSFTFERNPNYWRSDPLHPTNKLPYLDGVKWLVIPDASTRIASLRTAKIDQLSQIEWEEEAELKEYNPDLLSYKMMPSSSWVAYMRVDIPDSPFNDINVRRAMNMAVNNEEMAQALYGGNAEVLAAPTQPRGEHSGMYIPLDELPESTRELYEYHPDKAKQLLADAGYPNGFETSILCIQSYADTVALLADYWADIGVKVNIDVKEWAPFSSMVTTKQHQAMAFMYMGMDVPFKFIYMKTDAPMNVSCIDDAIVMETLRKSWLPEFYFDDTNDYAKRRALIKDSLPYILSQAWWVQPPCRYQYIMWWPWLKGYSGETAVGSSTHPLNFCIYPWLDQDLKKEMGH
ncbi:MAG: ABC transporter substrate-binding protein [Dehalococcoidia bacterium]|nr:ABC transporter substrate-binding protein [Dehalococcoidia bacterium]